MVEPVSPVVVGRGAREQRGAHPVPLGGFVDGEQLGLVRRAEVAGEERGLPSGDMGREEAGFLVHLPGLLRGEDLDAEPDAEGVVEAVGAEAGAPAGEVCGDVAEAGRVLGHDEQVAPVEGPSGEGDVREGAHRPHPPQQAVAGMAVEQHQVRDADLLRAPVEPALLRSGVDHGEHRRACGGQPTGHVPGVAFDATGVARRVVRARGTGRGEGTGRGCGSRHRVRSR